MSILFTSILQAIYKLTTQKRSISERVLPIVLARNKHKIRSETGKTPGMTLRKPLSGTLSKTVGQTFDMTVDKNPGENFSDSSRDSGRDIRRNY